MVYPLGVCWCHWPFCQVIAGLGAPEVSQCRMTDMPSITVLSDGPAVIFGAMPKRGTDTERDQCSASRRWEGYGGERIPACGETPSRRVFFLSPACCFSVFSLCFVPLILHGSTPPSPWCHNCRLLLYFSQPKRQIAGIGEGGGGGKMTEGEAKTERGNM